LPCSLFFIVVVVAVVVVVVVVVDAGKFQHGKKFVETKTTTTTTLSLLFSHKNRKIKMNKRAARLRESTHAGKLPAEERLFAFKKSLRLHKVSK